MASPTLLDDDLQFEDDEGVALAEWLESVLKNYCLDLAKRKVQPPDTSIECTKTVSPINSEILAEVKKKIYLFISSIKFEKFKKEMDETIQDFLKVEINYYVGDRKVRRKENFVISVSSSLNSSEPSIEKILETDKREIDFYKTLIPELEDWSVITGTKVPLKFAIPTCFFGEYETDIPPSFFKFKVPVTMPGEEDIANKNCPVHGQDLSKLETRAILILHDLEMINFKTKEENMLNIEEAKAVLRELADIHASSWAYQRISKKPLVEKWPFLLRPRDAVPVCVTLVEEGISALVRCLRAKVPAGDLLSDLTKRLKTLRPKLTSILYVLLTPPQAPAPSCVIHLDLQHRNLAFRNINGQVLSNNHKFEFDQIECRITQWKLVSVGSPMHDVAFLLLTSLTPDDRRNHASELIKFYYAAFRRTARHLGLRLPFKLDFLLDEYDKSFFFALLLIIGNCEEGMNEVESSILNSLMAAIEDVADSGYL